MANVGKIVTRGYGSYSVAGFIPTRGYGSFHGLIDNDTTASAATLTDVTAATAATLIDNNVTPGAATLTDV